MEAQSQLRQGLSEPTVELAELWQALTPTLTPTLNPTITRALTGGPKGFQGETGKQLATGGTHS